MARNRYSDEVKALAKGLFLRGATIPEINKELGIPKRTLHQWKDKEHWTDLAENDPLEVVTKRRLAILIERENKTPRELKEIDTCVTTLERLQVMRLRETRTGIVGGDADPAASKPASKGNGLGGKRGRKKGKPIKNDVSHLTEDDFKEKLHKYFFEYQKQVYEQRFQRNRFILKSRQIGFTWYFAQEAFENACLTGDNQIFLSATKAQARVFRDYIVEIAKEHFDIELKGTDKIELHTAHGTATLYFLSNNSKSAQSYHGHVYIDECFWIQKFEELYKVASAMASQKRWRKTLFSTPSSVTHQAYPYWTGDNYNKRFKKKQVQFPSFKELQAASGVECADSFWRRIITLDDALGAGCDLFDRAQLELEYSPDEFKNLFLCQFISDLDSVFRIEQLEKGYADASKWTDFDKDAERPFGNGEVWCGFDPARKRDDATFVVLAPPVAAGKDFRVLERHRWVNKNIQSQAAEIKKITQRYSVKFIGVDTTGIGLGVFDLVREFFPMATSIYYSPETKTTLVLKAKSVIEASRIKWDADMDDIPRAFLTVKQSTSKNSGAVIYASQRTSETGHADVAWAIMHALSYEPLTGTRKKSSVVIGD